MRAISILGLVVSLTACGSEVEPAAAKAAPEALVAEILHADLDGLERKEERLAALSVAIATTPPDVICLQGVPVRADRDVLKRALTNVLPFSVELPTTEDVSIDDPRGLDGFAPPTPERPPCAGLDAAVDDALRCYETCRGQLAPAADFDDNKCTTTLGCFDERKLDADPERRCPSCMISHGQTGVAPTVIRDRCLRQANALPFDGQHGTMILSRHRMSRPSLRVLPAAGMRRVVLGATMTTPAGTNVDVYCASLTPTASTTLTTDPYVGLPYPGGYGSPRDGWLRENELQVEQLGAHVHARREGRPAIVLGNFGASNDVVQWGRVILPASGAGAAKRLDEIFSSGIAEGYVPSCTVCEDNLVVSRSYTFQAESFFNRIYLAGIPTSAVLTSSRSYLGASLPPTSYDLGARRWPISGQYGFRSRISIAR